MTPLAEVVTERIPDPSEYLTMTGVMRAIEKGPQMHHKRRGRGWRVPVWAVACIVFGSPLAVLGCLATRPVAEAIYWWIH